MDSIKKLISNVVNNDDNNLNGKSLLKNNIYNKGTAFTNNERIKFKLNGLLPNKVETIEEQSKRHINNLRKYNDPIQKYHYLINIQNTNLTLFYRLVIDYIEEIMPLIYTPTVGQACIEYSQNFNEPNGIYITENDQGNIINLLDNWSSDEVDAIVVTDGGRILGLGDLSLNGMGIPIGKLMLYVACGGVNPKKTLPVVIDVGTNTESIVNDENYLGLKKPRLKGEKFNNIITEFFEAVAKKFGNDTLIQFEDFGNDTAFHLLEMTRNNYCTFNDDIQGTAAVTLSAIEASLNITKLYDDGANDLVDHRYLFLGAGEAGTGIAQLIAQGIVDDSINHHNKTEVTIEEARKHIFLVDSKGLIYQSRFDAKKLAHHKIPFAHDVKNLLKENNINDHEEVKKLIDIIKVVKPTVLIGVAAIPKQFTEEVCKQMCKYSVRPLIFALSNPTSKAECTAEQCYKWTNGKALFASGSPFDPVTLNCKDIDVETIKNNKNRNNNNTTLSMNYTSQKTVRFNSGQANNAYIFPGLGLGVLAAKAKTIPDELLLTAARECAAQVTKEELAEGSLMPNLSRIRDVSLNVAHKVAEKAFELKVAQLNPKPNDLLNYCKSLQYNPQYIDYTNLKNLSNL